MKDKSGYLKWGLTIFLTVCAILVFYDTFYMSGALQRLLSKLASILSPVLVGLVMAYLLAPIVNWFEKLILSGLHRIKGLEGKTIPHAAGTKRSPVGSLCQHSADLGHCAAAAVSDVQRGDSPAHRQRGDAHQQRRNVLQQDLRLDHEPAG